MPCNCLKCEYCILLNKKLVKEYHKINKNNININDFETELIQRLNYELIFKFLNKETLKNSTFLINDNVNCIRDDGHQQWILYIISYLLFNKIYMLSGLNLKLGINLYNDYIRNKKKCEFSIDLFVKKLAIDDAYDSCNYVINNNESYESKNGWKFYNKPIFNTNGNIDNDLINIYDYNYNYYYDLYYTEYELYQDNQTIK